MINFGPSGFCTDFSAVHKKSEEMPQWLIEHGLSAYEISFTNGINIGDEKCEKLGKLFAEKNALAAWYYCTGKKGFQLNMLGVIDISDEESDGIMEKLIPKSFQGVCGEELSEMVQLSHSAILDDFLK